MALGAYEHVRDVTDGTVPIQGVEVTALQLPPEQIFYRFIRHQEWDVSEISFAKAISFASQNDTRFVLLPVFPSRVFRHSSIYVRRESGLTRPEDLAGLRIGVPEWAQTAAVYTRGMLAHEHGVDLRSVQWFQAGVNEAGRAEKTALKLPEGLSCTPVPQSSLSDMLLAASLMRYFQRAHHARSWSSLIAWYAFSSIVTLRKLRISKRREFFRSCTCWPFAVKSMSNTDGWRRTCLTPSKKPRTGPWNVRWTSLRRILCCPG